MDFPAHSPVQLGAVLRGFRRQRGLTQAQLAALVGLTQKAISRIESHPQKVAVDRLFTVLAALGAHLVVRDQPPARKSRAQW